MNLTLALHHLLMDCIRTLRSEAAAEHRQFLESLSESLRIEATGQDFLVYWDYGGREFGPISTPRSEFRFYKRGDGTSSAGLRREGLRWKNWNAAVLLVKRIIEFSDLPPLPEVEVGASEARRAKAWDSILPKKGFVIPAALASISSAMWSLGLNGGSSVFLMTFLACIGLIIVANRFPLAHLRKPMKTWELLVVVLPVGAGGNPAMVAATILPLSVLALLEAHRLRPAYWLLLGPALLPSAVITGVSGIVAGVALLVIVSVAWGLARYRFRPGTVQFAATGILLSLGFVLASGLGGASALIGSSTMAGWFLLTLSLPTFLLWWVHGQQLSLVPITLLGCLCAIGLTGTVAGGLPASAMGLLGISFIPAWRVLAGLLSANKAGTLT
ncbi:MAG: hypothetical protein OHM77_10520 [Candidatus Nitricoxidivorans perseverans]|uniref:Uncharacterized protein n=1 Tax=Candidatus Nitricoxidivorans perseverans TaxID=2975601 RepID=A0AA49FK94_9PROT|nr:MAG: hypothetical protein OHM77_10520 [Candidatus Nitricoxidivorans perseverans]